MNRKLKRILLTTAFLVIGTPFVAVGGAYTYYKIFPPKPTEFVKMFEKPKDVPFTGTLNDFDGAYWPLCVRWPKHMGEIFAHHGPPCQAPEIGYIDGPSRQNHLHWRKDISPEDKAWAIERLKKNHMHYDGEEYLNFKQRIHPEELP